MAALMRPDHEVTRRDHEVTKNTKEHEEETFFSSYGGCVQPAGSAPGE
jgi:hypothetical protein